jgi:hypothetical protein
MGKRHAEISRVRLSMDHPGAAQCVQVDFAQLFMRSEPSRHAGTRSRFPTPRRAPGASRRPGMCGASATSLRSSPGRFCRVRSRPGRRPVRSDPSGVHPRLSRGSAAGGELRVLPATTNSEFSPPGGRPDSGRWCARERRGRMYRSSIPARASARTERARQQGLTGSGSRPYRQVRISDEFGPAEPPLPSDSTADSEETAEQQHRRGGFRRRREADGPIVHDVGVACGPDAAIRPEA